MAQSANKRAVIGHNQMPYEDAFDLISTGLVSLSEAPLDKLGGKRLIDTAAKMNSQYLAIEKLLEPLKDKIKVEAIENHEEVIRGKVYKAVIKTFPKAYWNFDKLKKFLGARMAQYQDTRNETRVSFEVAE